MDFERFAPYKVALVKLEEGPIVTAQLTDLANTSVEMVTRYLHHNGDTQGE